MIASKFYVIFMTKHELDINSNEMRIHKTYRFTKTWHNGVYDFSMYCRTKSLNKLLSRTEVLYFVA